MSDSEKKIFVLAGSDKDLRFFFEDAIHNSHSNTQMITPNGKGLLFPSNERKTKPLDDIIGQIKAHYNPDVGPINIVVNCHGSTKGTFEWRQDEEIPYEKFFAELKKNFPPGAIQSITLTSCYGSTAVADDILKNAPIGTIIQSSTGANTVDFTDNNKETLAHVKIDKPVDYLIESLRLFDPKAFKDKVADMRLTDPNIQTSSDPNQALPHLLGIGGRPPVPIDLADEVNRLSGHLSKTKPHSAEFDHPDLDPATVNQEAFERAINRVKIEFLRGKSLDEQQKESFDITMTVGALKNGQVPNNNVSNRIAYAIAAAYMDESGELQQLVDHTLGHDHAPIALTGPYQPLELINKIAGSASKTLPHMPVAEVPPETQTYTAKAAEPIVLDAPTSLESASKPQTRPVGASPTPMPQIQLEVPSGEIYVDHEHSNRYVVKPAETEHSLAGIISSLSLTDITLHAQTAAVPAPKPAETEHPSGCAIQTALLKNGLPHQAIPYQQYLQMKAEALPCHVELPSHLSAVVSQAAKSLKSSIAH